MKHIYLTLCLFLFVMGASGQSSNTKQPPAKTRAASTPNPSPDADPQINERRAQARSLLSSLATDARNFQDQTLRARSLARIADSLWQVDNEQARGRMNLFDNPLNLNVSAWIQPRQRSQRLHRGSQGRPFSLGRHSTAAKNKNLRKES